jgi:DsbC/DsbD-like thiol-disulfide interchange protein
MKRRTFLAGLSAICVMPKSAIAGQQWQSRLLNGGMEDGVYRLGLHIHLAEGWKTYWRIPGEGGVPPTIEFAGRNLKSFTVSHPVPVRHKDASGESIGYDTDVVFPVHLVPEDTRKPVLAEMKAFIGVCEEICIPVQLEATETLLPSIRKPEDLNLIKTWQSKVPKPTTGFVTNVTLEGNALIATLSAPVIDIFVEPLSGPPHHFKAPSQSRNIARLETIGHKPLIGLRGTEIRLTIVTATESLEQTLTVS